MLQVWFDDSGKGQLPAFVLAGYFGLVPGWRDFADKWQTLLEKQPKLKYIKAYEAFGLHTQFRGWSEKERDERLLEFVRLIAEFSGKGIAFVIDHEPFDVIVKTARDTPF